MNLIILVCATTATGLMAGLFFTWSVSVVPGLSRVGDREYISVMQAINKAIQRPVFFICFLGAVVLLPLSTYLNDDPSNPTTFWLLLAASVLYIAGAFGVTAFGNVPLNNSMEQFDLKTASVQETAAHRAMFENRWNRWQHIRAWASVLAFVLTLLACVLW